VGHQSLVKHRDNLLPSLSPYIHIGHQRR